MPDKPNENKKNYFASSKQLALEARIVLDAAGADTLSETNSGDAADLLHTPSEVNEVSVNPDDFFSTNSVIFIDTTVDNFEQHVEQAQGKGTIHLIEPYENGVEKISSVLQGSETHYDEVHILANDYQDKVQIGSTQISEANLDQYLNEFQGWSSSLRDGADIYLYGVEFSEFDHESHFIEKMSAFTNSDIHIFESAEKGVFQDVQEVSSLDQQSSNDQTDTDDLYGFEIQIEPQAEETGDVDLDLSEVNVNPVTDTINNTDAEILDVIESNQQFEFVASDLSENELEAVFFELTTSNTTELTGSEIVSDGDTNNEELLTDSSPNEYSYDTETNPFYFGDDLVQYSTDSGAEADAVQQDDYMTLLDAEWMLSTDAEANEDHITEEISKSDVPAFEGIQVEMVEQSEWEQDITEHEAEQHIVDMYDITEISVMDAPETWQVSDNHTSELPIATEIFETLSETDGQVVIQAPEDLTFSDGYRDSSGVWHLDYDQLVDLKFTYEGNLDQFEIELTTVDTNSETNDQTISQVIVVDVDQFSNDVLDGVFDSNLESIEFSEAPAADLMHTVSEPAFTSVLPDTVIDTENPIEYNPTDNIVEETTLDTHTTNLSDTNEFNDVNEELVTTNLTDIVEVEPHIYDTPIINMNAAEEHSFVCDVPPQDNILDLTDCDKGNVASTGEEGSIIYDDMQNMISQVTDTGVFDITSEQVSNTTHTEYHINYSVDHLDEAYTLNLDAQEQQVFDEAETGSEFGQVKSNDVPLSFETTTESKYADYTKSTLMKEKLDKILDLIDEE